MYPLRLRALGSSFAMTLHFVNQYGNSKAVPSMFLALTNGGTMFFFAATILVGALWSWFFIPELSGLPLETVRAAFELPWYQIGRKGKELAVMESEELEREGKEKQAVITVERVEGA